MIYFMKFCVINRGNNYNFKSYIKMKVLLWKFNIVLLNKLFIKNLLLD